MLPHRLPASSYSRASGRGTIGGGDRSGHYGVGGSGGGTKGLGGGGGEGGGGHQGEGYREHGTLGGAGICWTDDLEGRGVW